MRNLAGVEDCDRYIEHELRRARLVPIAGERTRNEVPYSVTANLGPLKFWRAWTYWVVDGPVPLAAAVELYADPIGKGDVRVAGHCGCPPPEAPWVTYVDAGGMQLRPLDGPDAPSKRPPNPSRFMAEVYAKGDAECRWVENPAAVASNAFVDSYHIDSEAGLRLFVDTVRRHLDGGAP